MENKEIFVEVDGNENSYKRFPFFKIIKGNWLLILILTIVVGLVGLGYGFLLKKVTYTASCEVIIKLSLDDESGYSNEQVVSNNTTLAKNYLPTISDVICSPKTAVRAEEYNKLDIATSSIGVGYNKDSLIIQINYTDFSEEDALAKLNDVIKASQEELTEEKIIVATDIKLQELSEYSTAKNDNRAIYSVIGIVFGLASGLVIAIVKYLVQDKEQEK